MVQVSNRDGRSSMGLGLPWEKGILMCSIFFDYDFVYGDKALVDAITGNFKNVIIIKSSLLT
jgi:signal-transduction protein with cAMP-binding, CBS, and nucleotidyltransferase domain